MTPEIALRAAAVLIAVLGVIDPVWTRYLPIEPPIAIRILDSSTLDLPSGSSSRRAVAMAAAERLRAQLGDRATMRVVTTGRPCPQSGLCLVIGDGPVDRELSAGATLVGAVDVSAELSPNVELVAVEAPASAALHGAARLHARLRSAGSGGTSRIDVRDAGLVVGSTSHEWSADESEATIDLVWTPIAAGPRRLRVDVHHEGAEVTTGDNGADVAVDVVAEPWPMLLLEPEATWNGTFIRRALEADARFEVRSRTQVAPGLSVRRGETALSNAAALEEARVLVVTAPDALTNADIERLEQFVRWRGGSLVLALDRRPSGPILRFLPPIGGERLFAAPRSVGGLQASEVMTFDAAPGVVGLDMLDDAPAAVSRALGRGRIVVVGALDAWRARDRGRFGEYWVGLVADAALAAPEAVDVEVSNAVAAPHQEIEVSVARHSIAPITGTIDARGWLSCGGSREPVRLWPAPQPGAFTAAVHAPERGTCTIEVSVAGQDAGRSEARGAARFAVSPGIQSPPPAHTTLAAAMAAHGAPVVRAGGEEGLIARVRQLGGTERAPSHTRPMRSPWWLLPFAACLSAEWRLRRRLGRP